MKVEITVLIFAITFAISSGFLLNSTECPLVETFPKCGTFFNDLHAMKNKMDSMEKTIGDLLRDIESLSIRLTNGTEYRGEVELYVNGYWGSICDESWDLADANVVCRMLGYNGSRSELKGGLTNSPYFTSQVGCTGFEDSIFKCKRMQSNLNFGCDFNRAAGVDCEMGVRLVGSDLPDRGRVEIQHKGEWGTICDPRWTRSDAEVVCRMVGMGGGRAVSQATFGAGTGRILLSNVVCDGHENHLMDCRHSPFRVHTCDHSQDVGVVCSN